MNRFTLNGFWLALLLSIATGASSNTVIVIGAGPAGLAAALEAAGKGARVTVIEMNSVGGGHGIKAGGFALVDTPLQRSKGINDSPDRAYKDWLAYGETNNPDWTRRYAEASSSEVYDWLTALGVEFRLLLPAAEHSVNRFHFTRGSAAHAMLPMLAAALQKDTIRWFWHSRAERLLIDQRGIYGVSVTDLRSQQHFNLFADQVIIATGGFQGALDQVRRHWSLSATPPETLLAGGSRFATGSGLALAEVADAQTANLNQQVIFLNALADPRQPQWGLAVSNSAAIWVNRLGDRFVDESASDKQKLQAVLAQPEQRYWAITDQAGIRRLMVRDAPWLNRQTIAAEILANPELVQQATTVSALAAATGMPAARLTQSVKAFNQAVREQSVDPQGRSTDRLKAIEQPPFYAIALQLMSRKNLGGLLVNLQGQVLDQQGEPISGLYAAGEVTGVAGINGSYGMSGTFLGPSVWQGRLAGAHAAKARNPARAPAQNEPDLGGLAPILDSLAALQQQTAGGFWHAQKVHELVAEQQRVCSDCHNSRFPARTVSNETRLASLETCLGCH